MEIMGLLAVLTNAVLVAFSSRYMDTYFFQPYFADAQISARIAFVFIFEVRISFAVVLMYGRLQHVVLLTKGFFAKVIPDVPKAVKVAAGREGYVVRNKLFRREEEALEKEEEEADAEALRLLQKKKQDRETPKPRKLRA